MPYTRKWNRRFPTKNIRVNQLDDEIRATRLDIEQRMQSVLAGLGNWTSDPVVPTTVTRYERLHWSEFKPIIMYFNTYTGTNPPSGADYWDTLHNHGGRIVGSASRLFYAAIQLPKGAILNDVDISCVTAANTSFQITVYRIDRSVLPYARTSLATRIIAASTAQGNFSITSGGNINHTVATNDILWMEVFISNTNVGPGAAAYGFQGVTIKYSAAGTNNV